MAHPTATRFPSRLTATPHTALVVSYFHLVGSPVAGFHPRTVLSAPPLTSTLPSGSAARASTATVCPAASLAVPAATSHTFTSLSAPADARVPAFTHATAVTAILCPFSSFSSVPAAASYTRTTASPPAVANRFPSGLYAAAMSLSLLSANALWSSASERGNRATCPLSYPAAICRPSGRTATHAPFRAKRSAECARTCRPVATSHTITVRSPSAMLTTSLPSGVAATPTTLPECACPPSRLNTLPTAFSGPPGPPISFTLPSSPPAANMPPSFTNATAFCPTFLFSPSATSPPYPGTVHLPTANTTPLPAASTAATNFSSGLHATASTRPSSSSEVCVGLSWVASHVTNFLSSPPLMSRSAVLGAKATARTSPLCPLSTRSGLAGADTSQMWISSAPALATRLPSALKLTPATRSAFAFSTGGVFVLSSSSTNFAPSCPRYTATSRPLPTSHTRTVPSRDPDANSRPSGEYATAFTRSPCRSRPAPSTRTTFSGSPLTLTGTCQRASVASRPAASVLPAASAASALPACSSADASSSLVNSVSASARSALYLASKSFTASAASGGAAGASSGRARARARASGDRGMTAPFGRRSEGLGGNIRGEASGRQRGRYRPASAASTRFTSSLGPARSTSQASLKTVSSSAPNRKRVRPTPSGESCQVSSATKPRSASTAWRRSWVSWSSAGQRSWRRIRGVVRLATPAGVVLNIVKMIKIAADAPRRSEPGLGKRPFSTCGTFCVRIASFHTSPCHRSRRREFAPHDARCPPPPAQLLVRLSAASGWKTA